MKKTALSIVWILFLMTPLLFPSCDGGGGGDFFPCKNKDCGPYGTCDDGNCMCDPGSLMDADGKCSILEREKAIGSYSISAPGVCSNNTVGELVSGGANMDISADGANINSININIGSGIVVCKATVSGSSITVLEQTHSGRKYTGTGTITVINNKTRIELTLIETDPLLGVSCTYSIIGV